ncbi:hypothetical protein N9N59_00250 [Euryarchaeota archaeon]|nr:hypothetical protein [Euryarchaeota archaeon]
MSGTLSPDGKWLWNGTEWIPAPPQQTEHENDSHATENPSHAETTPSLSYSPTPPPSKPGSSIFDVKVEPTIVKKLGHQHQSLGTKPSTQTFQIEIISKKVIPSLSIKIRFVHASTNTTRLVNFQQGVVKVRSYTATTEDGQTIGQLKLKGLTIFSGAAGTIRFPDETRFQVHMKVSPFGIRSVKLTDMSTGMIYNT